MVALFGPPFVIRKAWVKTWKEPMTPMTRLKNKAGEICGTVIWRNFDQRPAPSRPAASYNESGTLCSAARKISIAEPVPQRLIRISDGMAQSSLKIQEGMTQVAAASQPMAARPSQNRYRAVLSRP